MLGNPLETTNYLLFTHPGPFPKSATYIRNYSYINPQNMASFSDQSLNLAITVSNHVIDIYNVYSPGNSSHLTKILMDLNPSPNGYLLGDFNVQHKWLYAEKSVCVTILLWADSHQEPIED